MSTVQDQPAQKEQRGSINQIFPTPFEFKISNIEAVRQRARRETQILYSEPFYLFARGYKYLLRIEIHFNSWRTFVRPITGHDDLRVYIKVVPGEFDESLSWPCKEKVRLTLFHLDLLLDNGEDRSGVIDFGEEPCSRPLHDHHHKDRFILGLTGPQLVSCTYDDTILIRVNRE